jgi:branched-chain amino acid transport system substrate-binding protein
MRPGTWVGMVSAVVIAVSTADAQPCPQGRLRLYASWPLQGVTNPEAIGLKNGVDLAVAEVGGAVAGYCLEIVTLDGDSPETTTWNPAIEEKNAFTAVADPLAIVYIGPYSAAAATISMPITNRAHMAQLARTATYAGLTRRGTGTVAGEPWIYRPLALVNFFRLVIPADVQAEAAAGWAQRLGVKKVFVLHDGDTYGRAIAAALEAGARKIGLAILANEAINRNQPDHRTLLTRILASGADLVYMGGRSDTGAPAIIRQMAEAGLVAPRVRFMGPGQLLADSVLKGATCDAAMATDMRLTFGGLPAVKLKGIGLKTYEDYTRRFGKAPAGFDLYAVEAGRVAIDGIRRAANELERASTLIGRREAVRKAIAATKGFDGVNGRWSFDRNGDVDYADDQLDGTVSGFKVVKADGPIVGTYLFFTDREGGGLRRARNRGPRARAAPCRGRCVEPPRTRG